MGFLRDFAASRGGDASPRRQAVLRATAGKTTRVAPIIADLLSWLRRCGFDLEADAMERERDRCPKIGRRGVRKKADLPAVREAVVARVQERIATIQQALAGSEESDTKPRKGKGRRPTVNMQMMATIQEKPEAMGWNSPQWAKELALWENYSRGAKSGAAACGMLRQ